MPKISLVTTCYSHPIHYLIELINGLKSQTFLDFEWVVLTDGCDPSPIADLVNTHLGRSAPFGHVLIASERVGRSPALIKAVEASRGDYLLLMDSDDWLDPKCLEELDKGSRGCDLVFGSCVVYDALGPNLAKTREIEIKDIDLILQYPDSYFHPCLFTRELYEVVGGFDPTIPACIDYDLWLRMFNHSKRAIKRPLAIYNYRRHYNQMARTHKEAQYQMSKKIRERYANR